MDVKDLMVGDWVEFEGEFRQINTIPSDEEVTFEGTIEKYASDCNPIPLTSEILEKNGFERVFDYYGMHWHNDILQFFDIYGDNERGFIIEDHALIRCKYVHEFQHLLKLCGVTKEIMV